MFWFKLKTGPINMSQEITKTHIWQDLVNSDKQLNSEREASLKNHKETRRHDSKFRPNPITTPIDEDVNIPLVNSNLSNSIPTIVVSNSTSNNTNSKKDENTNL